MRDRIHLLIRRLRRPVVKAFFGWAGRPDFREIRKLRVSVLLGGIVATLTAAAIAVPERYVEAVAGAAAVFFAVAGVAWLLLKRADAHERENRALWSLGTLASNGALWPAPGSWAIDAEGAFLLAREVGRRRAQTVVELGPGTSSVILAQIGAADLELYGLEHDSRFAELTRWHLSHVGATNYTLLDAPLTPQTVAGQLVEWYDPAVVAQLPDRIDVLVVDGPPGIEGVATRAPAWPLLASRMRPGGLIFIDDADRWEERAMLREWLAGGDLKMLEDHLTFVLLEVESSGYSPPPVSLTAATRGLAASGSGRSGRQARSQAARRTRASRRETRSKP